MQAVQRLACLSITGIIHSITTAALKAMLDLLPLHLFVRREAVLSALRTLQTKHLKSGDMVSHIKILNKIRKESMIMPSDLMPVEFDFGLKWR